MTAYAVELENITKRFGEVVAVKNVVLRVHEGEFFSLLGPSGCGKTTTLRIIAGLETPNEGIVKLYSKDVTSVPTHKRGIGMVFQTLALFPHMNVYENIAFGLRLRGYSEDEIKKKVKEMLEIVRLPGYENRRVDQLSGGQRQRIALARALVIEPKVLLLDEPLGALDLKIRQQMMVELKRIHQEVGTTFIYVTHDQGEAMTMSDRIAVMRSGVIQQIGSPIEIYQRPKNRFVASFIGEAINFIDGTYKSEGVVETKHGDMKVYAPDVSIGKNVLIAIRPEQLVIGKDINKDNIMSGKVILSIFKGSYIEYHVNVGEDEFIVFKPYRPGESIFKPGEDVKIGWSREAGIVLLD